MDLGWIKQIVGQGVDEIPNDRAFQIARAHVKVYGYEKDWPEGSPEWNQLVSYIHENPSAYLNDPLIRNYLNAEGRFPYTFVGMAIGLAAVVYLLKNR